MLMANTPTLPWALPMYQHMKTALQQHIKSTKESSIRVAAEAGLEKLDKYYRKALRNESNIIATGEFSVWTLNMAHMCFE